MRLIIAASIFMLSHQCVALDSTNTDERMIGNAAIVMRLAYPTANSKLQIISGERAAITGPEEAILIGRIAPCVYEIAQRGGIRARVDFSKMDGDASSSCDRSGACALVLHGLPGFSCIIRDSGEQCIDGLRYSRTSAANTIIAAARFIGSHGCMAAPVKPPF